MVKTNGNPGGLCCLSSMGGYFLSTGQGRVVPQGWPDTYTFYPFGEEIKETSWSQWPGIMRGTQFAGLSISKLVEKHSPGDRPRHCWNDIVAKNTNGIQSFIIIDIDETCRLRWQLGRGRVKKDHLDKMVGSLVVCKLLLIANLTLHGHYCHGLKMGWWPHVPESPSFWERVAGGKWVGLMVY